MEENRLYVKKFVLLFPLITLFTYGLTIDYFSDAEAIKSKGTPSMKYGFATSDIVCGDRLCSEQDHVQVSVEKIAKKTKSKLGVFESAMIFTQTPPVIDQEKGYFVLKLPMGLLVN